MTCFTSRLESAVVVAIFSTNCDFDIWVAIVSPLIRTEAIIDCPASAWSILHRFVVAPPWPDSPRLRVHRAPGFPCALLIPEGSLHKQLGRDPRREMVV